MVVGEELKSQADQIDTINVQFEQAILEKTEKADGKNEAAVLKFIEDCCKKFMGAQHQDPSERIPLRLLLPIRNHAVILNDTTFAKRLRDLFLMTSAHVAAAKGNLDAFKKIVSEPGSQWMLKSDIFCFIPLYDALRYQCNEIIDYHQAQEIRPDTRYSCVHFSISLLHMFALFGQENILKAALRKWKNMDLEGYSVGMYPIHFAIWSDSPELLPLLFNSSIKKRSSKFFFIIAYNFKNKKINETLLALKKLDVGFSEADMILQDMFFDDLGFDAKHSMKFEDFKEKCEFAHFLLKEEYININQVYRHHCDHEKPEVKNTFLHHIMFRMGEVRKANVNAYQDQQEIACLTEIFKLLLPWVDFKVVDSEGKALVMQAQELKIQFQWDLPFKLIQEEALKRVAAHRAAKEATSQSSQSAVLMLSSQAAALNASSTASSAAVASSPSPTQNAESPEYKHK